jgi:2-oxoglutarate dehydrogenase E2 component (dihydrolipoamide succinyltransferase)
MKIDMLMPQMGESITEATIARWLKKPGDSVEKDEIILEISTDKVDSEIPAPETGILTEVLFNEGDVVPVKVKIAVIDTEAAKGQTSSGQPKQSPVAVPSETTASAPHQTTGQGEKSNAVISPLVKNLAQSHGIPLGEVEALVGTGAGGRVTKNDFMEYVSRKTAPATAPASKASPIATGPSKAAPAQPAPAKTAASMPSTTDWSPQGTRIVPMDRMREAIAEHMVRSKHTSPHVYSVQEIDVSNISKYRAMHKNAFAKSEGFNLSFTPFFLEAVVRGIQKFPMINCSVEGKSIILKRHVNLGCAVALGTSGLIVPVIKKAEELSLVGIARSLNGLATRARDKKLLPDDVAGGTFTVTNPGVFGTIIGTPIINQPQVAILCLGAIKKRPVVINDMIAIREMCYLTLSYDHRVIDGSLSGHFLSFLTEYLENWDINQPLR